MFLELVATFSIGLGAAGVVLLANHLTRGRLPRWSMPAAAGVAMIGFTIWSEYSWYARTAGSLPEGVVVARVDRESAPWKPWTYAVPQVSRFVAVDTASMRTHAARPGTVMVDLYMLGRWKPGAQVPVLLDCDGGRRAMLEDGVRFGPDGGVDGARWADLAADDPILTTACRRS